MKKILRILFFLTILLFIGAGIYAAMTFTKESTTNNEKVQVVASIYPIAYFASEVGGDNAEVITLTPSGIEPHEYELTTQDMTSVQKSKILFLNGGVENWGEKVSQNLQGSDVTTVVLGEAFFTEQMEEEGEIQKDPHVWLSPVLAIKQVEKITETYITKDPANAAVYNQNSKNLITRLTALDLSFKNGLANCEKNEIITSHAAFAYLAKAYGLKQVAIGGLSTEVEPSTQELIETAAFAKANNIKYIFFESLVSPKLSETIANEVGAKTLVLDPLEGIPQDEITQGKDYFTVMEENLKNLQLALQCTQ